MYQGVYNLKNPNVKKYRRTDLQTSSEVDGMSQYLPLSVDSQVHKMISEATSAENLVQLLRWRDALGLRMDPRVLCSLT